MSIKSNFQQNNFQQNALILFFSLRANSLLVLTDFVYTRLRVYPRSVKMSEEGTQVYEISLDDSYYSNVI